MILEQQPFKKHGYGVTQQVPANTVISGAGGTSLLDGFFKGVVTEVGTGEASVKFVSHVSLVEQNSTRL